MSTVRDVSVTLLPKLTIPSQFIDVTLTSVLDCIKTGTYYAPVNLARAELIGYGPGSEQYKTAKRSLPSVAFAGTFKSKLTSDNFESSSGIFLVDVDSVPDPSELLRKLKDVLPYLFFAYVSPGGRGLKIGLKIPTNLIKSNDDQRRAWGEFDTLFKKLDVYIDPSCKDVRRVSFVSYDPDLYFNPGCNTYPLNLSSEQLTKVSAAPAAPVAPVAPGSSEQESIYCHKIESLILRAQPGDRHRVRLAVSRLAGGYVAGGLVDSELLWSVLVAASDQISDSGTTSELEMKGLGEGWSHGLSTPMSSPDQNAFLGLTPAAAASLEAGIDQLSPISSNLLLDVDSILNKLVPETNVLRVKGYLTAILLKLPHYTLTDLKGRLRQLSLDQQRTLDRTEGVGGGLINFMDQVNGTAVDTVNNFKQVLQHDEIVLRRNKMSRSIEASHMMFRDELKEDLDNLLLGDLKDRSARAGLNTTRIGEHMLTLGYEQQYHPFDEWLQGVKWDGRDRLSYILTSLHEPADMSSQDRQLSRGMIIKWLKSIVACVYVYEPGFAPRGVLMLAGSQNIGKSSWFKYLLPDAMFIGGQALDAKNKDDVLRVNSRLLVELAEIDGSLTARGMASMKAFLSNDLDVLRKAYAARESSIHRRTVFGGTTNQLDYINDSSGGSRFWTVELDYIDLDPLGNFWRDPDQTDLKQLWAQIRDAWVEDPSIHLSEGESELLNSRNRDHMIEADSDEMLESVFCFGSPTQNKLTIREIANLIQANHNRISLSEIKEALKRKGVPVPRRRTWHEGRLAKFYRMPAPPK